MFYRTHPLGWQHQLHGSTEWLYPCGSLQGQHCGSADSENQVISGLLLRPLQAGSVVGVATVIISRLPFEYFFPFLKK